MLTVVDEVFGPEKLSTLYLDWLAFYRAHFRAHFRAHQGDLIRERASLLLIEILAWGVFFPLYNTKEACSINNSISDFFFFVSHRSLRSLAKW